MTVMNLYRRAATMSNQQERVKRPDLSLLDDVLKDTKLSTDGIVAYMDQQARNIKALEDEVRTPREGDEHYFDVFDDLVRQAIRPSIELSGGDFESLYDGSGTESGDERDFLAAAIGQCVGFLDDRLGEKGVKIAEQAKTIERLLTQAKLDADKRDNILHECERQRAENKRLREELDG